MQAAQQRAWDPSAALAFAPWTVASAAAAGPGAVAHARPRIETEPRSAGCLGLGGSGLGAAVAQAAQPHAIPPRAAIGQRHSTRPFRTPTYQS